MKLLVSNVMVSDWIIAMFYKSLINKYEIKEVMTPKNMKAKVWCQAKKKVIVLKQGADVAKVKSRLKMIDK